MARPTDILREYGQAIRGLWSDLDGRCVRDNLDEIAKVIEDTNDAELSQEDAVCLREDIGICPAGKGHWTEFCDASCETPPEDTSAKG